MTSLPGMRPQDQPKFSTIARNSGACGYWILVRATNENSLQYIGRAGYVPKPKECKPKTADFTQHAGLVVCPILLPQAFNSVKLIKATKIWNQWANRDANAPKNVDSLGTLPAGFSVDAKLHSERYGCLRFGGNLIHGDYDLFDVVDPLNPTRWIALATSNGKLAEDMISELQIKVKGPLNALLGVDMIQHGVQAAFGTFEDERVLAFGPKGETLTFTSAAALEAFYKETFSERRTLNLGG